MRRRSATACWRWPDDSTPVQAGLHSRTWPYPAGRLYLQSVRTGPSSTDFGRLFDRADPGSIVAVRGESVVAPQALFFLNDPFVNETGPSPGRAGRA